MHTTTLRLFLISPLPPPYGGISHWTTLMQNFANTQDDIDIKILDIAPRWRASYNTSVWMRAIGGGGQLILDFVQFLRVIVTWHPQVIHLNTSGGLSAVRDIVFLTTAKLLRIPTVYHIHFGRTPELLKKSRSLEAFIFRRSLRLAARIVPIDRATYNSLKLLIERSRVTLIPNCYNPADLPQGSNHTEKVVIFLGWVIPAKGIEELLEAWRSAALSGWKLSIVGPGDASYIEFLAKQSAGQDVTWHGPFSHKDAMRALSRASILVLPSHTEGFPNVVLEAMAMGRAIVATKVGAIPEMLEDGAGLLVPPRDVVSLSAALKELQTNYQLIEKIGKLARERAETKYSIATVFQLYRDVWYASLN